MHSPRNAQSSIEYSLIAALVIAGILIMGPYTIRSINAFFKSIDDGVQDSFSEEIKEDDIAVIDLPECIDCEEWGEEPNSCGGGGCLPFELIITRNCPETPGNQFCPKEETDGCREVEGCCEAPIKTGRCGAIADNPLLPGGRCDDGHMEFKAKCGLGAEEFSCSDDQHEDCLVQCLAPIDFSELSPTWGSLDQYVDEIKKCDKKGKVLPDGHPKAKFVCVQYIDEEKNWTGHPCEAKCDLTPRNDGTYIDGWIPDDDGTSCERHCDNGKLENGDGARDLGEVCDGDRFDQVVLPIGSYSFDSEASSRQYGHDLQHCSSSCDVIGYEFDLYEHYVHWNKPPLKNLLHGPNPYIPNDNRSVRFGNPELFLAANWFPSLAQGTSAWVDIWCNEPGKNVIINDNVTVCERGTPQCIAGGEGTPFCRMHCSGVAIFRGGGGNDSIYSFFCDEGGPTRIAVYAGANDDLSFNIFPGQVGFISTIPQDGVPVYGRQVTTTVCTGNSKNRVCRQVANLYLTLVPGSNRILTGYMPLDDTGNASKRIFDVSPTCDGNILRAWANSNTERCQPGVPYADLEPIGYIWSNGDGI